MSIQLRDIAVQKEGRGSLFQEPSTTKARNATAQAGQQEMHSSGRASLWRLFAFTTWRHAGVLAVALAASATTAALKTTLAVILGKVFDVVAQFGSGTVTGAFALQEVSRWCLIITALGISQWLSNTVFLAMWVVFGELQADSVRRNMFTRLLARNMAWFDSLEQGISSLLVRIQTQTRELQSGTSQVFGHLACETITSFASLGMAMYFSWKLTLVLLATLPVSMVVLWLASRRLEPAIQAQRRTLATASKHVTASITAIDLIKTFNGSEHDLDRYSKTIKEAAKHYLIQARCSSIQVGYTCFWVINLFVVGFWYGVVLVNDGLRPGVVITTFYATLMAFQGVEVLLPHWLVIAKGVSAGLYLSNMAEPPQGHDRPNGSNTLARPDNCAGAVELSDVSFVYPANPIKSVIHNSSLIFPAGETTFIVGRSGSGKSTIGSLVSNLYEPSTGHIYLDGRSYGELDKDWIRNNVTLIQQTSVLFNDTFFGNISLGHLNPLQATYSQVQAACSAAFLQTTIATLPNGLNTMLGAGGYNLSGGQKQRLALARAHLRDPPVLILDEVTSGLDQITRIILMEAIRKWRRDKTTIIITHDTSQISNDDLVYVIDNAHVVEKGLKCDLLKHGNSYLGSIMVHAPRGSVSMTSETLSVPRSIPSWSSPSTSKPRSNRASQVMSQFSMAPLFGGGSRFTWSMPSRRLEIDTPSACDLRYLSGQTSQAQGFSRFYMELDKEVDEERSRFSAFVNEKFSLTENRSSQQAWRTQSLSTSTLAASDVWDLRRNSVMLPEDLKACDSQFLLRYEQKSHQTLHQTSDPSNDGHISQLNGGLPTSRGSLLTTIRTVWPALDFHERLDLVLGLVACLISAGTTPAFAYCFAKLLGAFWSPGDKAAAGRQWALALVGIAVIDGAASTASRFLMEKAAQAWVNATRLKAFRKILGQSKTWFDQAEHSAGRLNECLDRSSEEMRNIVGKFVPILAHVAAILTISVIWALVVSWKLTLVSLAPIPVIIGAIKSYSILSSKWEKQCNKSAEDASAVLTEIFFNIRVVKSLTLEAHFTNKYLKSVADTLGEGLKRALYPSTLYGLYQSTSYAVVALVFYYGTALMTMDDHISATEMMQVVNLLLFAIGTASSILSHIPQVTMAQATATKMLEFAEMDPLSGVEHPGRRKLPSPLPLRVNDLSFSYPSRPQRKVLQSISFDVSAGRCTVVVGHSGCGKSTLISLLLGLYPPDVRSGTDKPLTFFGVPPAEVDIAHLRSMMAYVPQAPFLFPGTMTENIAYGLSRNSPYQQERFIHRAAQEAGVHDFIVSLPNGYNTIVGEGGQALSGGQAQRVNIARAIVRQPKLLLLDEPTSALDAESAEMVRRTLKELMQRSKDRGTGMGVVLITHSREMMQVADTVVVLEDGRSVEEGKYVDLLHSGGPLTELLGVNKWKSHKTDVVDMKGHEFAGGEGFF